MWVETTVNRSGSTDQGDHGSGGPGSVRGRTIVDNGASSDQVEVWDRSTQGWRHRGSVGLGRIRRTWFRIMTSHTGSRGIHQRR